MPIRNANTNDLPNILSIYNWAVEQTVATFDTEVKNINDHRDWFKDFDNGYPLKVIEIENKIIGFGLLKAFSDRKAYDTTCELTIYILPGYQGQNLGSQMMDELIDSAKAKKIRVILSKIEAGSSASINIHKKFGFEVVGTMNKVGFKFDRWLDVTIMQKILY